MQESTGFRLRLLAGHMSGLTWVIDLLEDKHVPNAAGSLATALASAAHLNSTVH